MVQDIERIYFSMNHMKDALKITANLIIIIIKKKKKPKERKLRKVLECLQIPAWLHQPWFGLSF